MHQYSSWDIISLIKEAETMASSRHKYKPHPLSVLIVILMVQVDVLAVRDGPQHNTQDESVPEGPLPPRNGNDDDAEWYWRDVKAILGGVLGFWGGVGSLGTLFLVVVLSQRYCCRKDSDKAGNG